PLGAEVMRPQPQTQDGQGDVALSVTGKGREGTLGVFGRAQSHPLCHGPSRGSLLSGIGADQFQGKSRCSPAVQRGHGSGAQSQTAATVVGRFAPQPGSRFSSTQTESSRATRRQTPP